MTVSITERQLHKLAADFGKEMPATFLYCPLLSAAIAANDESAILIITRSALKAKIAAKPIEEIILQSHLFLGFPAMIEAARLYASVVTPKKNRNRLPGPYTPDDCRSWNKNGLAKISCIYGPAFDRLVDYINSFSPQVLTWMINDGYGQVLSRPGASFPLRELSVVATLTVTAYNNQLGAHIRGTLNIGVSPMVVERTIKNCRFFCGKRRIESALNILNRATAGNAKKG